MTRFRIPCLCRVGTIRSPAWWAIAFCASLVPAPRVFAQDDTNDENGHDAFLRSPGAVVDFAMSADGQRIAAAYYRGPMNRPGTDWHASVVTWDLATGERLTHSDVCAPLAFSPDGKRLACARYQRQDIFDRDTRTWPVVLDWEGGFAPHDLQIEPALEGVAAIKSTTRQVIVLGTDGRLVAWPADGVEPMQVIESLDLQGLIKDARLPDARCGPTCNLQIDDGLVLLGNGYSDTIKTIRGRWTWNASVSKWERALLEGGVEYSWYAQVLGRVQDVCRGAGGRAVVMPAAWSEAFHYSPRPIDDYRWSPLQPVATILTYNPVPMHAYRDPPSGDIFVIQTGPRERLAAVPGSRVLSFSRDGSQVIVSDNTGAIRFWDIKTQQLVRTLRPDDRPVRERPPNTFRVAAVQYASEFGDPEENRRQLKSAIEIAAYREADIIVLPEAAVSGYLAPDLKHTWQVDDKPISPGLTGFDPARIAEAVPGASTEFFAKLARQYGLYITVPLVEVDKRTQRYYNTVVLLDPRGEIVIHYRKLNPWPWAEQSWATEGDRGLPVVDTPFGRLGVLICFDIHQQGAKLAELKIDTLLYSIAWVEDAGSDWFDVQLPARAKQYGYNIVAANWTLAPGTKTPTWHGYGQSRIIDAQGRIMAKAIEIGSTEIIYADLELPQASKTKEQLESSRDFPRSEPDGRDSSGKRVSRVSHKASDENSRPQTFKPSGDGKTLTLDLGGGVTMDLVLIEAGSFQMVINQYWRDNESVSTVFISKPYYLGKAEITQAQWKAVMGSNPSGFQGDELPVEGVSWDDAQEFCQKLSLKVQREMRLPTEAEWEYACRAGSTTKWCCGDLKLALHDFGWFAENAERTTHAVGSKKPNAWGLYDMHGNVWEWCQDWSGAYSTGNVTDPTGPTSGTFRVVRGGSWYDRADFLRSTHRYRHVPSERAGTLGFRVASQTTP